jgi:hypothetical protein
MHSASRLPLPSAPAGHWTRLASPSAIGTYARIAHDPEAAPFVRQTHGQLLSLSLAMLADSVRTISTR